MYPFSLMKTGSWTGPDLNGAWNLALACAACNLAKSSRLPKPHEVSQLMARNDAIAGSPHPLRRTLELTMTTSAGSPAKTASARKQFLQHVGEQLAQGRPAPERFRAVVANHDWAGRLAPVVDALGLDRLGTLAPGKNADFIVLDTNPLDDIHNSRRINAVYLRGQMVDRAALRAKWTGARATE